MKIGLTCILALIPLGSLGVLPPERSAQSSTAALNDTSDKPCVFDVDRGEVPNCLRESKNGSRFVAPEIVKQLRFDAFGMAPVRTSSDGWMYVNRHGRVLISGVPAFDNWADSFHDGLVRFVSGEKYGFANRKGKVVVAPIYDGAMNFDKGRATVCKGCESRAHVFAGGDWFEIDTSGTVLRRLPSRP